MLERGRLAALIRTLAANVAGGAHRRGLETVPGDGINKTDLRLGLPANPAKHALGAVRMPLAQR